MARLTTMPPITIASTDLALFGATWTRLGQKLSRTPPQSSSELGRLFDTAVAHALAQLLGVKVFAPNPKALTPPQPDCVELGPVRIVGGVRPQDFDVGYRPDGVRFAFDSKTLNDQKSIGKNWQNMINDLATEATTVHSRFPHALVAFIVVLPEPCVSLRLRSATIETLERLARRVNVDDPAYMAEAISLVLWNPSDGSIDPTVPALPSSLRLEKFSKHVENAYVSRYKGLPPHAL